MINWKGPLMKNEAAKRSQTFLCALKRLGGISALSCWRIDHSINKIRHTPKHTKRPMMVDEFQANWMPPHWNASSSDTTVPMSRTKPIPSREVSLSRNGARSVSAGLILTRKVHTAAANPPIGTVEIGQKRGQAAERFPGILVRLM